MHIADALVTPAVAGTIYACSAAVAAYSKPVGGQTPVKAYCAEYGGWSNRIS